MANNPVNNRPGMDGDQKLDLEMHARIEAGLLDNELPRASQSVTPAPTRPKTPSLWQALKRFFH